MAYGEMARPSGQNARKRWFLAESLDPVGSSVVAAHVHQDEVVVPEGGHSMADPGPGGRATDVPPEADTQVRWVQVRMGSGERCLVMDPGTAGWEYSMALDRLVRNDLGLDLEGS